MNGSFTQGKLLSCVWEFFFSMVPIVLEIRHCSYRIFTFARQMYAEWIRPSGLIRELDKVDGLLDIHLRFLLGVHQQVSGLTLPFFFFSFSLWD